MRLRNTFTADCRLCHEHKPGCATCAVLGWSPNAGDEWRVVPVCAACRRKCRDRCKIHPKHRRPNQ